MRTKLLLAICAVLVAAAVAVLAPLATAVTPTFANYAAPSTLPASNNAGEPSIGADWNTGAFLYQASATTYRITLSGGTPTWVAASRNPNTPNLDPILFTDSTLGRTWAGGLDGSCSLLSFTDNDGASWTPVTNSCSGTIDHESIGAGPYFGNTVPVGATYPHVVYYCAQETEDACATSTNGGLTFGAPVVVLGCSGLHGHVKVSSLGVGFLPNAHCNGIGGGITTNNGLTWGGYHIPSSCAPSNGFDPSAATTDSGWLYQAWQGCNNHLMVSLSKDNGTTWSTAKDLSSSISPAVVTATMPAMVAGKDGNAAVAYLGTTGSGNAFSSGFTGTWDLYVSVTYDSGATWSTVKVTSDPVQRGWICAGGIGCSGGRNLLDFIDATTDASGDVVVAYADGCIASTGCAGSSGTISQSTSAWATIAVQTGGTPLR